MFAVIFMCTILFSKNKFIKKTVYVCLVTDYKDHFLEVL